MASRRRAGFALVTALALATSWASGTATPARAITALTVNPLDLGTVDLGSSNAGDVLITNSTGGSVTINSFDVSTGGSEFSITGGTCAAGVLADGASCTVTITFTPLQATGAQSAGALHVNSVEGGDQYGSLHGTGFNPMTGGGTADFGDQPKGSTSTPIDANVSNVGSHPVQPTSASITGTNAGDFAKGTDTCTGISVPAGSNCAVSVTFHPTAMGPRTATLTISFPAPIPPVVYTLNGNGLTPNSSVVWHGTYNAAPNYTWNFGSAMARTVKSGVQQLHVIAQTDYVGGKFVTDSGPYLGVVYTHATTGSSWSSAKRLNPSTQHGSRVAIAASGAYVYAVWVSLKHWDAFSNAEPRVLYFRANSNHGASSAWKTTKRITGLTGRVDFPTVAANGKYVLVTWTDSNTGAINLARSVDYGATFKITKIGTTSYLASSGYKGLPKIAISGAYVIVAWMSNNSAGISTRISSNYGSTWGTKSTLVSSSWADSDGFSATMRSSRAAVSWVDSGGVKVRVRTLSWAATRVVTAPTGNDQYEPAVALQGTAQLAVSWGEYAGSANEPLMWAESPNNGAAFYQPQAIADTSAPIHTGNELASVIWVSAGTRLVAWNGFDSGDANYRIYFRTGTGTPTGLALPAPLASVSPAIAAPRALHRSDRFTTR